jgi:hypothetical protein
MYRASVLTIAFALLTATAALAQFPPQPPPPASPLGQGTEQERAACHPAVVRFCQAELAANESDTFAILSCLQRNRTRINRACAEVLASHGQ